MSYTQAEHLFAGVKESGVNDIFKSFFTARGRHLLYGSPPYIWNTSAAQTYVQPIPIVIPNPFDPPNPLAVISYGFKVQFAIPTVDINLDSTGGGDPIQPLNPPVPGMAGDFRVKTAVHIQNLYVGIKIGSLPTIPVPIPPIPQIPVYGRCEPVSTNLSGTGAIGIKVKEAKIDINVSPSWAWLINIVNLIMVIVLQFILKDTIIPYQTVVAGAFGLILQVGPLAEKDQFDVRGSAL
ncbi:MAG TPA: hypothetical protein VIW80_05790 [Pyrinomonadaceae bacterium]|jgi:hypothetical protein